MIEDVQVARGGNIPLAFAGALAGALAGAVVWAGVTAATNYQIGFMAIGVGFLAAWGARKFGHGHGKAFAIAGGTCALLGAVAGNVMSVGIMVAIHDHAPVWFGALAALNPSIAVSVLKLSTEPMDFVFYAIAAYFGFKYAQQPLTRPAAAVPEGS